MRSTMAVRKESVNFTGALGDALAARIDRPVGPIRGFALFAHCFTCSKDLAAARRIADGLAERRSEEGRVGKECVSTCRSRRSTYHKKNKTRQKEMKTNKQ